MFQPQNSISVILNFTLTLRTIYNSLLSLATSKIICVFSPVCFIKYHLTVEHLKQVLQVLETGRYAYSGYIAFIFVL